MLEATRFEGKLHFCQNFQSFIHTEVKIILTKSSDEFFLLSDSKDITFKIKDIFLQIPLYRLSAPLYKHLTDTVNNTDAVLRIKRPEFLYQSLPPGEHSVKKREILSHQKNISSNQLFSNSFKLVKSLLSRNFCQNA